MQTELKEMNVRQANMELLRIIAMFIILLYHTILYVFYDYRDEQPIFASLLTILHIGVPLFILISGYFGIKPSVRGFFNLYISIVFYNLIFYVISLYYGRITFSIVDFIKLWLPFSIGGGDFWFFKVYIMLYLFSPVLNFLKEKWGVGKCLLFFGVLTFYFGWAAHHPSLIDGKNVVNFSFIYLLGFWIKKNLVEKKNALTRINYVITYLIITLIIGVFLYYSNETGRMILKRLCYWYNSPLLIIMSALFFMIFTSIDFSLKINLSKCINWIAGSVLSVYLVHENQYFFQDKWYGLLETHYLSYSGFFFVIILLSDCLLLYIASVFLDKIRVLLLKPIMPLGNWFQKLFDNVVCEANHKFKLYFMKD